MSHRLSGPSRGHLGVAAERPLPVLDEEVLAVECGGTHEREDVPLGDRFARADARDRLERVDGQHADRLVGHVDDERVVAVGPERHVAGADVAGLDLRGHLAEGVAVAVGVDAEDRVVLVALGLHPGGAARSDQQVVAVGSHVRVVRTVAGLDVRDLLQRSLVDPRTPPETLSQSTSWSASIPVEYWLAGNEAVVPRNGGGPARPTRCRSR